VLESKTTAGVLKVEIEEPLSSPRSKIDKAIGSHNVPRVEADRRAGDGQIESGDISNCCGCRGSKHFKDHPEVFVDCCPATGSVQVRVHVANKDSRADKFCGTKQCRLQEGA
jgi:uncharacterized Zn-finger protein